MHGMVIAKIIQVLWGCWDDPANGQGIRGSKGLHRGRVGRIQAGVQIPIVVGSWNLEIRLVKAEMETVARIGQEQASQVQDAADQTQREDKGTMRDNQVIELFKASTKRDSLILGRLEFIRARLEAIESVISNSSLRDRIEYVIWPDIFKVMVDREQRAILEKFQRSLDAESVKSKIIKPGAVRV